MASLAELTRAAAAAVQKHLGVIDRRPPGMPEAMLLGALRVGLADIERKVAAMAAERERTRGPQYEKLKVATEAQAIVRDLARAVGDGDLEAARTDLDRLDRKINQVLLIAEG